MSGDLQFNVVQFFANGDSEVVRENVGAKAAVEAAKHYTSSIGARLGMVRRVIITDAGDDTNFEWKYGEGITYPLRNAEGIYVADDR